MPWKVDENGHIVVDADKNPVFVLEGGEEKSVDYPAMAASLVKANREAKERKDKLKEQESTLALLNGIEDVSSFIADAKKNAETVKNLGEKEKDAEAAARARVEAAVVPLQKQIADLEKGKANAQALYQQALIDAQFSSSQYVNTDLVSPALAKELFAKHFSIGDDNKIQAKDANGEIVYDENGVAGFDAALRKLVTSSAFKDVILKGTGSNGSDASKGQSGGTGSNTPKSLAECKTQAEMVAYLNNEANLKG